MENKKKQANQYTEPDPRQQVFLKYYLDPKSKLFANAYQSALKAGYSQEYAKTILSQDLDWLSDSIRDESLIKKAERNLDIFLEGENEKIKADITKFVLSRLNKKKYSERIEQTGADGKDLGVILYPTQKDEDTLETYNQTDESTSQSS